jgi:large subunit ribosomal protein L21|tara:strand:- start:9645 stop:10019 length:375 start_codon:yes stop_codon:yes gene_type:complete
MFAIVNISGKQYRVTKGEQVKVPSLNTEAGKKVSFDQVLLTDDGKKVKVGTPTIKGVSVSATVINHGRDRKVVIFKKKRRKGYRRKNGHRQSYSLVQIDAISASAPKKKATPKKKIEPDKKKEK